MSCTYTHNAKKGEDFFFLVYGCLVNEYRKEGVELALNDIKVKLMIF